MGGRRGNAPRLYDASTVVGLLLKHGGNAVQQLADGRLLDLTIYEVGNALRRLHHVEHRLTHEQLQAFWTRFVKVTSVVSVIPVSALELETVMAIAMDRNVTFYDAAYRAAAAQFKLELESADRVLRR